MRTFYIEYTLKNLFRIGPVRFMPGIQKIDEDQWDKIKSHPLLQTRFDNGDLKWVPGRSPNDEKKKGKKQISEGLADLNESEALKMAARTFDISLLKEWAASEKRAAVLSFLKAQIDKVDYNPAKEQPKPAKPEISQKEDISESAEEQD